MPKPQKLEEDDRDFELVVYLNNGEEKTFSISIRYKQSIIDLIEKIGKKEIPFAGLDLGDGDKLFIGTEMFNNSFIFVGD